MHASPRQSTLHIANSPSNWFQNSPVPSDEPLSPCWLRCRLLHHHLLQHKVRFLLCMFKHKVGGISQESQGCQVLMQAHHAVRFGSQTSGFRLDFAHEFQFLQSRKKALRTELVRMTWVLLPYRLGGWSFHGRREASVPKVP
jgi:hypothetical protein